MNETLVRPSERSREQPADVGLQPQRTGKQLVIANYTIIACDNYRKLSTKTLNARVSPGPGRGALTSPCTLATPPPHAYQRTPSCLHTVEHSNEHFQFVFYLEYLIMYIHSHKNISNFIIVMFI